MSLAPPIVDKIGKLLRLLSSDKDAEVISAVCALRRTLDGAGASLHDLADTVEKRATDARKAYERGFFDGRMAERSKQAAEAREGLTWKTVADFCHERADTLCEKEQHFVRQMAERTLWCAPTERQGMWLFSIYIRLGGSGRIPSC